MVKTRSLILIAVLLFVACLSGSASAITENLSVVYCEDQEIYPFNILSNNIVGITVKDDSNNYWRYFPDLEDSTPTLSKIELDGDPSLYNWNVVYQLGDDINSTNGYIQSFRTSSGQTSGQYIDTNLNPQSSDIVHVILTASDEYTSSGSSNYAGFILGSIGTSTSDYIGMNIYGDNLNGKWYLYSQSSSSLLSSNEVQHTKYKFDLTQTGTSVTGFIDETSIPASVSAVSYNGANKISIFKAQHNGFYFGGKLYGNTRIYINNILSRDYIPISYNDGTNTIYALYDRCLSDNVIYSNDGVGSFSGAGQQSVLVYKHETNNNISIVDLKLTSSFIGSTLSPITAYVSAISATENELYYQWCYSLNSGETWNNISNQTNPSLYYIPENTGNYYLKVIISDDNNNSIDSFTSGYRNIYSYILNGYIPESVTTKISSVQAKTLETYQATNEFDFGSIIQDVVYKGDDIAYVAAGNAIYVVDGSDATISSLTSVTGNTISKVYFGKTRAIINDIDNNVAIYDYSDKSMTYIATNGSDKVAISQNYAYVVNDTGWLNIYDLNNSIVASMQYTYPYLEVNQKTDIFGYRAVASYYRTDFYYYSLNGTSISSHNVGFNGGDAGGSSYVIKAITVGDSEYWAMYDDIHNSYINIFSISSSGVASIAVSYSSYTVSNIDVSESLSSIFNDDSVIYVYGNNAVLQGEYATGGNPNDLSLSYSNGLYAIAGGNDSNAYFINKESSSSWVLGQATNFGESLYFSKMSYDGSQTLVGTANKLFLFKYTESVDSNYYLNGVVVGSDGLPYANKIITIDATSVTTDDSGFFVYPVKPGQTYTIITGTKTTRYTATNQALQTLSIKIQSQLIAQDVTYGAVYNSTSRNIEMTYNDAVDKTSIVVWSVRDTSTGAEVSRQTVSAGDPAYYFVPTGKENDNYFVTVNADRDNTSVKNTWSITPSGEGQTVNLFGMDETGRNILFGFFLILLAGLFGYMHQHIGTIIIAFAAAILRYLGLITVPWIMILIAVVVAIVAAIAHRGEGK